MKTPVIQYLVCTMGYVAMTTYLLVATALAIEKDSQVLPSNSPLESQPSITLQITLHLTESVPVSIGSSFTSEAIIS